MIQLPRALVRPFTGEDIALDWFMPIHERDQAFGNKAILCADNERVSELNERIQTS